ncbi:MAG: hypothetical protein K2X43_11125 [Hyphomonadaceae bacterium]|nr:hypothetical protein [Hyphomonadaceae bacterium]
MSTDLTHDDVQSILKMIDAAEHLQEVEIVHGRFRLHVIRNGSGSLRAPSLTIPLAQSAGASQPIAVQPRPTTPGITMSAAVQSDVPEGAIAVRAPMLGVFYRASGPGERPFVEVGQRVQADDTVCLIEVMKLFNSIRAGVEGEIVKIVTENGALVEFDEALIYVKPSKD